MPTTLRSKMLIVFTVTGLIPLLIMGIIGLVLAVQEIQMHSSNYLRAIGTMNKKLIIQYINTINKQASIISTTTHLRQDVLNLRDSFYEVAIEDNNSNNKQLIQYYQDKISNHKSEKIDGIYNASMLVDQLNARTIFFQSKYLAKEGSLANENLSIKNQSYINKYNEAFFNLKGVLDKIKYDYENAFLIDSLSGDIFFSLENGIEFANSLVQGPLVKSSLASVYQKAKSLKYAETIMVDYTPYLGSPNQAFSFIASPIFHADKLTAIFVVKVGTSTIDKITKDPSAFEEIVSSYLVDSTKSIISNVKHSSRSQRASSNENSQFKLLHTQSVLSALEGKSGVITTINHLNQSVLSNFQSIDFKGSRWAIITEMTMANALSTMIKYYSLVGISSIALVILIIVISYYFSRNITRPLGGEPEYMLEIASEIERGDLTRDFSTYKSKNASVHKALNNMCQNLKKLIGGVVLASEKQRSSATELTTLSNSTLNSIEIQTAKLLQVVSAMEEMAASAKEITLNTSNTADKANDARAHINQSVNEIDSTTHQITNLATDLNDIKSKTYQLAESSNNISTMLETISKISDQTNLLALNAAIEAARAGEHGRGFAIVAGEVKNLAQSSQKAAKEISDLINSSKLISKETLSGVDQGTEKAEAVAKIAHDNLQNLHEAVSAVESIADMTQNMASAANQQAEVAEYINQTLVEINDMAIETTNSMLEVTKSTSVLENMSVSLKEQTDQFTLKK